MGHHLVLLKWLKVNKDEQKNHLKINNFGLMFSFILATALEAQAEALLEAAEAGKMTMPGAENLQMYNEAMNIWKEAQDLKGNDILHYFRISMTV